MPGHGRIPTRRSPSCAARSHIYYYCLPSSRSLGPQWPRSPCRRAWRSRSCRTLHPPPCTTGRSSSWLWTLRPSDITCSQVLSVVGPTDVAHSVASRCLTVIRCGDALGFVGHEFGPPHVTEGCDCGCRSRRSEPSGSRASVSPMSSGRVASPRLWSGLFRLEQLRPTPAGKKPSP